MTPALALSPAATIAVIGDGRLGGVLATALRAGGLAVTGPHRRDETIPASDIALLCVPDAEIAVAAVAARPCAALLGHVSGATPFDHVDFGLHPLQTFTGAEGPEVFHGIGAAIAGRTADARAVAEAIARALGARPFVVDDAHRAVYHAAASTASNLVLSVLDAAEQLARAAGIRDSRELLAPLVERTIDNWARTGASGALTGPISRGDETTVRRQREAVAASNPALVPLFDQLCESTRELAVERRRSSLEEES